MVTRRIHQLPGFVKEAGNVCNENDGQLEMTMPQRNLRVYVDGFNLYHGIHASSGRANLWLDLVALARSLRPQSHLEQVIYFTASILDDPDGASRQAAYQKALLAQNSGLITIVQGRYQKKRFKCKTCGARTITYEEKETDVNIAVQLATDAAVSDADLLVISADSDLAPAVRIIRLRYPNTFVAAAFPPQRFSAHLQTLMPASFHIGDSKITAAQLPDPVIDRTSGQPVRRPSYWS